MTATGGQAMPATSGSHWQPLRVMKASISEATKEMDEELVSSNRGRPSGSAPNHKQSGLPAIVHQFISLAQ